MRKNASLIPKLNPKKLLEILFYSTFGHKMKISFIYAQRLSGFVGKGEMKVLIMPKTIENTCYVNRTRDFFGYKCTIIAYYAQSPISVLE